LPSLAIIAGRALHLSYRSAALLITERDGSAQLLVIDDDRRQLHVHAVVLG
jgi:hypothetical protein